MIRGSKSSFYNPVRKSYLQQYEADLTLTLSRFEKKATNVKPVEAYTVAGSSNV
jgi:hypothetical protein